MARASGTTPSVGFKRPLEGGITRSGRSTTSRYAGSPSEQQQEQQACTLDIGDHARARKTDVSLTFENLMCFCCNDYTGGNMMRQECSRPDCNVWSFFCSRHVFRPDFPVTVCMTCKSPGARVLLANTVTSIMKNCILLPCQKSEAGCQELETTDKMEAHLQHACMYNYVPCPKPGCLKR